MRPDPRSAEPRAAAAPRRRDDGPLLIVAGAGTGKTQTLAHRVAALIARGADPRPHPAAHVLAARGAGDDPAGRAPAGAAPRRGGRHLALGRDLPRHRQSPLAPSRGGGGPRSRVHAPRSRGRRRSRWTTFATNRGCRRPTGAFPRKGTCLAIYSSVVNTQVDLRACLETRFPWCLEWEEALRALYAALRRGQGVRTVLDYDDLLLYWFHLMERSVAGRARSATPLRPRRSSTSTRTRTRCRPRSCAAQARRSRRDRGRRRRAGDLQLPGGLRGEHPGFPAPFHPPAARGHARAKLPLDAAHPGGGQRRARAGRPSAYEKRLFSRRGGVDAAPVLATVPTKPPRSTTSSRASSTARGGRPLAAAGGPLQGRAPQRRAGGRARPSQHPVREVRRPPVSRSRSRQRRARLLRWAENLRDSAGGVSLAAAPPRNGPAPGAPPGPARSRPRSRSPRWPRFATGGARDDWPALRELFHQLGAHRRGLGRADGSRPALVRAAPRAPLRRRAHSPSDLDQLEQLAAVVTVARAFLSDLTLDPPSATGAEAGPPYPTKTT